MTAVQKAYDKDKSVILTSDKDHKIRVSTYPKYYNIENFCLGHTEFISKLSLATLNGQSVAVSGSGDGFIRVWDYLQGNELFNVHLSVPFDLSFVPESLPLVFTDNLKIFSRFLFLPFLYFLSQF